MTGEYRDVARSNFEETIRVKQEVLADDELLGQIAQAGVACASAIAGGHKLMLCGNGGSASDSMHIAGEIVGRFTRERRAWPAIALPCDVVTATAIANDYSYADVFARQVEGYCAEGDVLIGISTSGNSENVVRAVKRAKKMGCVTIALCGATGGYLSSISDICIKVPSTVTARIQESHIVIGHTIAEIIEDLLCREQH